MSFYGAGYGSYGTGSNSTRPGPHHSRMPNQHDSMNMMMGPGPQAGPSSLEAPVNDYATQASAYTPGSFQAVAPPPSTNTTSQKNKGRKTVLKKGAGYVWEDQTLLEWDPAWFRLFIGNLGNDVNDDDLEKVFGNSSAIGVKTFVKAKVVRDPRTTKTKGFGFVAYTEAEDYMKAWKAMEGKYVGSRPITIKKATTQVRAVEIGDKKAKKLEADMKKRHKEGGLRSQRGGGVQAGHGGQASYIRR